MMPRRRRRLEVILDTTERCNLKCTMCYFSAVDRLQFLPFDRQLSRNGMMPFDIFSRIAADLFPHARRVALGCAAEPLMHPKFIDIVREAGRHGVPDLWFPTNLLPLTRAKAEAICEAGVRTVGVSMDGTRAETYETIRVGATFPRLLRSLDLLNEVRRGTATRLRLIFVWMKTNRADLADLPRFAEDMGASELDVRFVAPTAHVDARDELLDNEDPAALRAELAATAEDAAGRGLRLVSYPDFDDARPVGARGRLMRWRAGLYDRQRLRGRLRTAVNGCAWPRHTVVVRPNGAVTPCIFWEEQPIGLYPETTLGDVERSPLLLEIVDGLKNGNPCGTCRTCSERKHALYFRLQWRQQAGERLEQLGAGPGSGGVAAGSDGQETTTMATRTAAGTGTGTAGKPASWPASAVPGLSSPSDWIARHTPAEPFRRVLLVGDEAWGRELLRAGFAANVDLAASPGLQSSPAAVEQNGIRRIPVHPRRPRLPTGAYQAVCCIGSLSSGLRLERLLDALLDALEPGGRLLVDDYVGPARHQWNRRNAAAPIAAYRRLSAAGRRFERLPMPPVAGDCARATRSGDVVRLVRTGFRVESARSYGGDLLAPLGAAVDWSRLADDERRRLIQGSGNGDGHYTMMVARPRTGWRRRIAGMRYRVGPRVRRVFVYEPRRARDLVLQALRGKV